MAVRFVIWFGVWSPVCSFASSAAFCLAIWRFLKNVSSTFVSRRFQRCLGPIVECVDLETKLSDTRSIRSRLSVIVMRVSGGRRWNIVEALRRLEGMLVWWLLRLGDLSFVGDGEIIG